MKWTIEKNVILDALNNVTKALSQRTTIPVLNGIVFDITNKGIELLASDSELTIKVTIPEKDIKSLEGNGRIIIQSKYFIDMIRKMPADIIEFEIEDKDLKIDTYRSSGAGGQHVNKTESAIRITHLPTGIVVACQDERSQIKNKDRAMSILRSKLYDFYQGQIESEYKENRKSQVGTGDRSERVRTYNYPQGRVTDHRVNVTSYSLTNVLNGDIDMFIEALTLKDRAEKLANA